MIALLVALAGFAVIFGANGLAERLTRIVVGLVLIVTFLPGVLARAERALRDLPRSGLPELPRPPGLAVAFLVVAAAGFAAWKLRAFRARRHEALLRRHGTPRDRSLPPPPGDGAEA
jgi:hypothetical protein